MDCTRLHAGRRSSAAVRNGPGWAVLVAVLAGCAPASAQSSGPAEASEPRPYLPSTTQAQQVTADVAPFIEVAGTAQVSVPTDRARVSFAVETEDARADVAARENAEVMTRVMAATRASDAPGLSVETFGYSLDPRYADSRGETEPRIAGYRALNHIRVTVDDVDAVGELIDGAIGAGANRIASIQFEAIDTEPVRLEAVREAVQKARAEAAAIADALGVQLGGVLEVRGGAQAPLPVYRNMARMEMAQVGASTPVEAGSQMVTAHVTVRFAVSG